MNTLNYKVLSTKTALIIFIRALVIYLLITLPTMGVPLVYLLSAAYALSFGWIAGALFLLLFFAVQKLKTGLVAKQLCLYAAVAITVLTAFQMMEVLGAEDHIWQSGGFLIFPCAAVVSGWVSLAVSKQKINSLFSPVEVEYYMDMGAVENIFPTQKNA